MQIYRPIKRNYISQFFGQNKLPIYKRKGLLGHNGIDWVCKRDTPIYWECDVRGKVYKTETDSAGGRGLDIISDDGKFKHRYWHLNGYNVEVGDIVETGDLIAYSGNTGESTGPHLHYGIKPVKWDSEKEKYINIYQGNKFYGAVNPTKYLTNIFVLDHLNNLKGQISILRKMILIYETLIDRLKKR